jgi:hypothetical protein
MSRRRIQFLAIAAALVAPAALSAAQTTQDRLAYYLDLYNKESDPVRRAKIFPHLGTAQLDALERIADGGDFVKSGTLLEQYRDEVKSTFQSLKGTGMDAERKPNGFKELEIHLRKALPQIDEVIRKIPEGPRVPFQVARRDVVAVDRELIDMLFPRHPAKGVKK